MKNKKAILRLLPPNSRRSRQNRPDFTSEAGIARRLAEGRGLGTGPTYKTWLRVQEFRSSGYRRMVWSPKLGRIVHLLSGLEWKAFLYAEFMTGCIDIRENYPLDRSRTRKIAKLLGFKHPAPDGTDIVMTTDLYLTMPTPEGLRYVAWTVKYEKDIGNPRVQEKFAIERAYHAEDGVAVHTMTENSFPSALIENLEFVRGTIRPGSMDEFPEDLLAKIDALMRPQLASGPLGAVCEACDQHLNLEPGMAIRAVRYFIATRRWPVDLHIPITMNATLEMESSS